MRAYLVLDTNFFMHGKSLESREWLAAAKELNVNVTDVVLAVPPIVVEELERKKTTGDSPTLRRAAGDAVKLLWRYFSADAARDAALARSANVVLRLLPNRTVVEHGDARMQDDQVLGALQELRRSEPGALVAVVSRDYALRLRAIYRGFATSELKNGDWRDAGERTRQFDMESAVLVEGVNLTSGDGQKNGQPVVRKTLVDVVNEAEFGKERVLHEMRLRGELAARYHASAATLDAQSKADASVDEKNARIWAQTEARESHHLEVRVLVENTGNHRLRELDVDPLELFVAGKQVALWMDRLEWGTTALTFGPGGRTQDSVGINPSQTACFGFSGRLPTGLRAGRYPIVIKHGVVSETLARGVVTGDDPIEGVLEIDVRPPVIRFR